jgi:hypothetical protein
MFMPSSLTHRYAACKDKSMLDRDLKERLTTHIKQHPTDATEILAIVSGS